MLFGAVLAMVSWVALTVDLQSDKIHLLWYYFIIILLLFYFIISCSSLLRYDVVGSVLVCNSSTTHLLL